MCRQHTSEPWAGRRGGVPGNCPVGCSLPAATSRCCSHLGEREEGLGGLQHSLSPWSPYTHPRSTPPPPPPHYFRVIPPNSGSAPDRKPCTRA